MAAMKKANGGELHKLTQWISGFMTIPLGKYIEMPVNLQDDGVEKCSDFMTRAKETLDRATYGLADAKSQILQWLGKSISNRTCSGTVIGVHGPMGTGKTTLLSSVSKILGDRPFHLIALGGATDSSYLEGHLITYEGSTWGHIVECLRRGTCMNPVFFFDELDKISDTSKGAEIIGILTHLTDPSQNNKFFDKFFSIELDLSRAIFVFSYNDKSKIDGTPLGDRMFKIETAGYSTQEKIIIAESHLIPSVCSDVNFKPGDVSFPRETLTFMIENYTGDERGVRNLKRCIETVVSKLNLYRIMRSETKLITGDTELSVAFPYVVPVATATAFLKTVKQPAYAHMYM
jgi:ATP-dependent Lon protease